MKKINVAELLSNCPSGMELDCTMFEGVEFDGIVDNKYTPIRCRIKNPDGGYNVYFFTKHGYWNDDCKAKCVIFPKGKTTWEGFHRPFKNGDIVTWEDRGSLVAFIYKERKDVAVVKHHFALYTGSLGTETDGEISLVENEIVFATEEEKAKLFKSIRDNGYKWNPDIKTLEKLVEPKFKVGDRIRHKCPEFRGERIVNICCDTGYFTTINDWIDIAHQDDWELVSEKLVGPKFNVGDIIQDMDAYKVKITEINIDDECYGYESIIAKGIGSIPFNEQDNWKLVSDKFDITSLKTFDQVLVRDFDNTPWEIEFFSRLLDGKHFKCSGLSYVQCIPYKGNEHLNGKKDDCDKYFKTWE